MTKARNLLLASTILGAAFAASAAQAGTLAVLTGDDTLTMVDTGTQKAGKSMKVSGIGVRRLARICCAARGTLRR